VCHLITPLVYQSPELSSNPKLMTIFCFLKSYLTNCLIRNMAEELTTVSLEEFKELLNGTTVAVVEPSKDMRAYLKETLRLGKARVLGSVNGEEVLKAVKKEKKIDAVVADSLVVNQYPGVWNELPILLKEQNIPLILLDSGDPKIVDQIAARTNAKMVIYGESYRQGPTGTLIKTVAEQIEMVQPSLETVSSTP